MLTGVLYFHRISDFRIDGISRKNSAMFRKICGENALRNVIIVTNMWGEVNPRIGEMREAELKEDDMFFKSVLDKGARIARHDNTSHSAEKILRLLLRNYSLPLRIQKELVDEGKEINGTDAGEELNRELNEQIEKYKQEMQELKDDMEQAMWERDEETKKDLEIETEQMREVTERLENDSVRLGSDYEGEKKRLKALMEKIELEAREEMERVKAQFQQEILRLTSVPAITAQEKNQQRVEIDKLSKKAGRARPNFFSKLAGWADNVIVLASGRT